MIGVEAIILTLGVTLMLTGIAGLAQAAFGLRQLRRRYRHRR